MSPKSSRPAPGWAWLLFRYHHKRLLLTFVVWLGVEFLPLVPGWLIKVFFDSLTQLSNHSDLNLLALLMVLVALLRSGFAIVGTQLAVISRFAISSHIRKNLLHALIHQISTHRVTASTVNHFRDDVDHLENAIDLSLDFVGKVVFSAVAFSIMLHLSVALTLLVFVPFLLMFVTVHLAQKRIESTRFHTRESTASYMHLLGETLKNAQAIQLANTQHLFLARLDQASQHRQHRAIVDRMAVQMVAAVLNNGVAIGTGLILLARATLPTLQNISVGDMALFVYYLAFVTSTIEFFGNLSTFYQQAGVSMTRLMQLVGQHTAENLLQPQKNATASVATPASRNQPLLELRHVALQMDGCSLLSDIHLTVPIAGLWVITGPTGSGKSSLLKVLAGQMAPTAGTVVRKGETLGFTHRSGIPDVAYVGQKPGFFQGPLLENLTWENNFSDAALQEALRGSALELDLQHLPDGLDSDVGHAGDRLSGGQKRRVALARALLLQAQLTVLDDPTGGLDTHTEQQVVAMLQEFARERTVVVATQSARLLTVARNVVVLRDGRMVAEGGPDDMAVKEALGTMVVG